MTTIDARTYARALYETLIGTTTGQLRGAASYFVSHPGRVSQEQIDAALPANATPEVRNFLAVLASQHALDELVAIADAFETYVSRGDQPQLTGEIISAVVLSESQRAQISGDLQQRYGQNLELAFKEDPSLIGGLIIRVGDQVLDNSLRTRLSIVQRSMLNS
jgi:F-type H+-transporting ATPase subunit delta